MSQPISDSFAQQLQQMRADTLAQLRAQRGGAVSRAEAAADLRSSESDDWAQAGSERDLAFALDERESAELVAIDAALQRIADGSYTEVLEGELAAGDAVVVRETAPKKEASEKTFRFRMT